MSDKLKVEQTEEKYDEENVKIEKKKGKINKNDRNNDRNFIEKA